jgi:hypothetical protein
LQRKLADIFVSSLNFQEQRLREGVKRDALFRDRLKVIGWALYLWFIENHAHDCQVITHALLLISVTPACIPVQFCVPHKHVGVNILMLSMQYKHFNDILVEKCN